MEILEMKQNASQGFFVSSNTELTVGLPAYDRWNSSQTIIDLSNEGLTFNPFGQGYGSMSAPTKQFEALILSEQIEHFGNPVLR